MNSHLPVGRLAGYLEAHSRKQIWTAIAVATVSVTTLDHVVPGIGSALLYLPIICGAAWGLGVREGRFVAFIAAFLTVLPSLHASPPDSLPILALRVLVCTGTFIFLAATVTSFRRSYDRELFHAHRDRMTGMLNKEVFDNRLRQGIRDAAHTGQTLLLVILDLDDFKAVNNRHGHQAGDEVLRTFAKGASSIMRREDLIGRIGGDEFGLLVRVPSIAEGQGFARDIHARLTAVLSEGRYPVTCSMGAVLIPPDAPHDADALMRLTDRAMYRAKHAGKDDVEITSAGEPGAVKPIFATARLRKAEA
jgi:diguanylate cyclase (GGDEF)-like protein